ncbi:ABC transporter permease [Thalassobacillus hwangdonensis]|uniref:ABC transporter permease n=1 Tax=Thalassobacillus hwangdonensis TaxID=546108 RepID=A0ABW3KVL7_9BACI
MKFKDRRRFISQNLKKNKSRVFMTILATAIGCAFLIVLASVGFGAQKFITNEITQDRVITEINVHGKSEVDEGESPRITNEDIAAFEDIPNVKAVSRKQRVMNDPMVQLDGYIANTGAVVVDYPSEIKAGFKLFEGRMPEKENEVIVGYHLIEQLYSESADAEDGLYNSEGKVKDAYGYDEADSLIGKEINLVVSQFEDGEKVDESFPLTVVGVTEAPSRDWMRDTEVLISSKVLSQIEAFTGTRYGQMITPDMPEEHVEDLKSLSGPKEYEEVNVIANSMENVKGISQQLKDQGYFIYSVTEELQQVNLVFALVKFGLIFIGTIALLIASIGIYNTMSMAVTERTQDIGIMKAIGGHPRMIRSIFLLESGYIGLIGAIVGLVAAYVISIGVNAALPIVIDMAFNETLDKEIQLSYIPPYLAVLCILLSIGVAMLSGLKPARKATKIDVLRALRRDI